MSRIQLEGLTKVFTGPKGSEVRALEDVSLDIFDGELVVLLGPSGCGKTTMLRCIAGLETPTSGVITIGDRRVYDHDAGIVVQPDRRGLGMVFQSYALWPHMSVRDNVGYPLKRRKVPRGEIGPRVDESLRLVDCLHLALRYPHELSGGQQQRIAVARALVGSPRVLLFDEPLSNLDAGLRDRMRSEIRSLQRRIECTAVYVTHDQREALAVADRVVVMSDGHILQSGSPEDVYERPESAFVADFLGASNLIPVTERLAADQVETGIGTLRVSAGAIPPDEHSLSVAVRQESLFLVNGSPATDGTNIVECPLASAEFLGDHRLAVFERGGLMLRAKLPVSARLEPGQRYRIGFDVEASRLVHRDR